MEGRDVIHPLSGIAPLAQFELWSVPPTQVSVLKDIETEVRPLSTLSANQPVEFIISSAKDEYINLGETYIYVKARVIMNKDDRSDVNKEDWDSLTPVQYFLHSIFAQCSVKIGNKEVTLAPQTYYYRAFIESLLSFTSDAKKSHMRSSLWTLSDTDRNKTVRPKENNAREGRWFELMGRLHTDLTFQDKSLIGGCEVGIKLNPNDPKVYFTCNGGLRPELEYGEVTLLVHKSKVCPSLVQAHSRALSDGNTRYAITRCEVRQQGIPRGQLDALLENVIRGQMPRRMFVFLVDTVTFNGSYSRDPYDFKHFDVIYLAAYIDGVPYPGRPYTPNFDDGLYTREFLELYTVLNQNRTDSYMDIDYESFGRNRTIFAFDFAPDLSNGPGSSGHVNSVMDGSLRLHFRFKRQLDDAINVLMYCEFDNMIEIDEQRNAVTNYN